MIQKMFRAFAVVATGLTLIAGSAFSQANTSVDIVVANSATPAATRTLSFGVNTGATAGIDGGLGEQAFPPFPPSSVFEARFVPFSNALSGTEGSPKDFRPSTSAAQSDTFHIKFQAGTNGLPVNFTWSTSGVSSQYSSMVLRDVFGGALGINVNMLSTGTLSVTNGAITELELIATGPIAATTGLGVSGCPLNFGIVQIPTPGTGTQSLTLSKTGANDITIDSITSSDANFTIASPSSFPQTVSSTPLQVDVLFTAPGAGMFNSTITIYYDGTESTTCVASATASSGEGIYFVKTSDSAQDNSTGHTAKIGLKYSGTTPAQGIQFKIDVPNNIEKINSIGLGSDIATPANWVFDYQVERTTSASEVTVVLYGRDTTVNLPALSDNLLVVNFDIANIRLCNGGTGGDDSTVVMTLNSVQSALATELGETAGIGVDADRDSALLYVYNGSARGDVNCDDRVDVLDLLVIKDDILGRLNLDTWQENRADLAPWSSTWATGTIFSDANNYGDGVVGVQDLVLIINAILNEQWPDADPLGRAQIGDGSGDNAAPIPAPGMSSTGIYDVKFTYEVSNDGIKVEMHNLVPVKGYQMKIKAAHAPQDLEIKHVDGVTTPFDISRAIVNGEIRIVAITANGESIPPMNGTLMNLPFSISNPNVVAVIEPIIAGGANNESLDVDWEKFAKVSGVVTGDTRANAFSLDNAPNPFNGNTMISYTLPTSASVSLTVTDASGRDVATLIGDERQAAGNHSVEFDAATLSNGVYFYTLSVNGTATTRRMVLSR